MKKILATAAVVLPLGASIALAPAHAESTSQHSSKTPTSAVQTATNPDHRFIIGGTSSYQRNIVQVTFTMNGEPMECSGNLIDEHWVLTARHCADSREGIQNVEVAVGAYKSNYNRYIPAASTHISPYGDVALIELSSPITNVEPIQMNGNYSPVAGDEGTIIGFGLRANQRYSFSQNQAEVDVIGRGRDLYNGEAIYLEGYNGAANHGDSGGALIIDGELVGVCSRGDVDDPGADIHATAYYSNISAHRNWIRQVSGV